jgi:hypothetical protein
MACLPRHVLGLVASHRVTWAGMLINSALLFYLSYIPAYFILLVNRLRGISTELALPNVRVAFAVTKAPSEPWPLARTTLLAMLSQRFDAPYDVMWPPWRRDVNAVKGTSATSASETRRCSSSSQIAFG